MSNKILYERTDGGVGKIVAPIQNSFLIGGDRLEWRQLDAKSLPYTGNKSGALANVSVTLDYILGQVGDFGETIRNLSIANQQMENQNREVLLDVQSRLAAVNTFASNAVNEAVRATHKPGNVALTSNPALTLDLQKQTWKLDFNAKGSFDDSRAMLGVNSVQQAFDILAARLREATNQIEALQVHVSTLQKWQTTATAQITALTTEMEKV